MVHLFCDSSFRSFPISIVLFSAWVNSRAKVRHICFCCHLSEWVVWHFFTSLLFLATFYLNYCKWATTKERVLSHLILYEKCRVKRMAWSTKLSRTRIKNKDKKLKTRIHLIYTQTTIHIHGGQTQSEQIASNLQKEKTEAENGNLTMIIPQISSILEISGFLSPNALSIHYILPLGSTALFLHQNYYKLLNQDYGDLF